MNRFLSKIDVRLVTVIAIFAITSKVIFDNVYLTSQNVIDEAFHLPQGLAYCKYNFSAWDPKITTLPGLYLITSIIFGPLDMCTVYWLRFVNIIGAVLNLYLFYCLFNLYQSEASAWKNLFSSLNLSLLPPMYFFSHLYYTDVISITILLLLILFEKQGNHLTASFFGMCSVIMRQTNVIWVAMIFGRYFIKHLVGNLLNKKGSEYCDLKVTKNDLKRILSINFGQLREINNLSLDVWLNIVAYLIVLICFGIFVIFNGSIVVGDKEAHTMAVHVPQLMYFALFCVVFAWPYCIMKVFSFLRLIVQNKLITTCIVVLFVCIIHLNTLVHPYLLADNRHYTFYIWNYFYGRYRLFKYFIIPVYLFGLYCILSVTFSRRDISFGLVFLPCTFIVLVLQKLIEIRYFLIPFILLRLHFNNVTNRQLLLEFLYYLSINVATMRLFFNKNIYWVDFDEPQKLIW